MLAKWKITFFKELLPSDPLGPVTYPLIFIGIGRICLNDLSGRSANFLKPREVIGQPGNDYLGKFGGLIRLDILPPAKMVTPSPSLSARGTAMHMV
jgi:hypothetical protein